MPVPDLVLDRPNPLRGLMQFALDMAGTDQ
jgi:hypothetical protein